MSSYYKFLSALCVCFLASSFVGCDSPKKKIAEQKKEGGLKIETVTMDGLQQIQMNMDEEAAALEKLEKAAGKGEDVAETEKPMEKVETFDVSIGEGMLNFKAPATWEMGKPTAGFVEAEITVPMSEGDENNGRLTLMRATGSIDDNVRRWYGQYTQPDGGSTEDVATVRETKIGAAENRVTWVDITGTLQDKKGGPMSGGPTVERENYRMLAAIIQASGSQCFVKLYGPNKTISDNEAAFKSFVESLKINDAKKGM